MKKRLASKQVTKATKIAGSYLYYILRIYDLHIYEIT